MGVGDGWGTFVAFEHASLDMVPYRKFIKVQAAP